MTYKQVRAFNQSRGGSRKGFCLQNVRLGFGISPKYASAWEAWQGTQQHKGNAPQGVDVPVFFAYYATIDGVYKNWGHIGVRLANGKFWSDGTVYASISGYTRNHSPRYVGWGESVNGTRVLQAIKGGSMALSPKYIRKVYKWVADRTPSQKDVNFHAKNSTPESLLDGFIRGGDLAVLKLKDKIQNLKTKHAAELKKKDEKIEELTAKLMDKPTTPPQEPMNKWEVFKALIRELLGRS